MVIEKQTKKEIRSGNLLNFANIDNVWTSKEAKLIVCIAFFCSKFMQCLESRFWPHAVQTYERWEWKIA